MSNEFDKAIAVTLDYEGGNDDDKRDPGGRTSRGITQREWLRYRRMHSELALPEDVWRAPQSAILDIYRTEYWNPMAGDQWPAGLDLCVFDGGVNSGAGRALAWARAALAQGQGTFVSLATAASAVSDKVALIHRYQTRRLSFVRALRTWQFFGRGWARRIAGIEAIATRWTLEAAGHPPEVVKHELERKSQQAKTKSTRHGVGVGGTTAVTTQHDFGSYMLDTAIIIVVVCLTAWLVYHCWVEYVRGRAFAGAAR